MFFVIVVLIASSENQPDEFDVAKYREVLHQGI
jgi:hypothetical protein